MSSLKVSVTDKDTERAELFLKAYGNQAKAAVRKSLNRAVNGVKTDAAKEVRAAYNVKAMDVKKTFLRVSARGSKLEASAVFTGNRIPLHRFGAKPAQPKVRAKAGVTVQVKATRKVVQRGFVAQMKSGHVSLFKRVDQGRLPLRLLEGPAVPQMVNNMNVRSNLQAGAVKRFTKNLDHEMDYLMRKGGK